MKQKEFKEKTMNQYGRMLELRLEKLKEYTKGVETILKTKKKNGYERGSKTALQHEIRNIKRWAESVLESISIIYLDDEDESD